MKQFTGSDGQWALYETDGREHHEEGDRSTRVWHSPMVRIEDASGYEDHEVDDLRSNYIDNLHCWM